MADLGLGQRAEVMPHYPHMLWEDRGVWTAFLETEGHRIQRVWYDVHVGEGLAVDPNGPGWVGRLARGVSRKRIDVVCKVGGGYWVVEVKPLGGMVALGQIVTYARLFETEFELDGSVAAVVVCDGVDPDVMPSFEAMSVGVFVNKG